MSIRTWLGRLFGRANKDGCQYTGHYAGWPAWRAEIRETVRKANAGSGRVRITIEREETGRVGCLLWMNAVGIIVLSHDDMTNMYNVCINNTWGCVSRMVVVTLPFGFDENRFVEMMDLLLEKIEVDD